jgi:hypothetical protein
MTNKRWMKKRGGGFMDSLNGLWDKTKKSSADLYNSTASATTGAYNSAASATTGAYNSATGAVSATPTPSMSTSTPTPTTTSGYPSTTMGGRRRRHLRGGNLHSYMSRTNIAATAAPFTVKTAQPQVIVGGKTRKRKCNNRHHKSCKSRKSKKCKNKHHKTCKRK